MLMTSTPPDGYAVPKTVTGLVTYATAYGWKTLVQWAADSGGNPFVNVEIGRLLTADEAKRQRGDRFDFRLTYHSRSCTPGMLKRFGTGLAQTPDKPQWHDAPALWKIREVIYLNPAPDAATTFKGPITKEEFNTIPNARALRFSHDRMGRRYTEWIENMPRWGWSLMSDYGQPEHPCHVSRADSRAMAADHLTAFLAPSRAYGGDHLTVDEWEIGPWPVRST
ncbi:hypothetical protein ACH4FX_11995 [Streptomyces sp. NPDC018019]|uniref:hypothetical protein n=1 Tax=Streptomyces sp. NPDC018019 TaxID=3365030 RepID=UPI0037B9C2F2